MSNDKASNARAAVLAEVNAEAFRYHQKFKPINDLVAKAQKQLKRGHHKAARASLEKVALEAKQLADDIAKEGLERFPIICGHSRQQRSSFRIPLV